MVAIRLNKNCHFRPIHHRYVIHICKWKHMKKIHQGNLCIHLWRILWPESFNYRNPPPFLPLQISCYLPFCCCRTEHPAGSFWKLALTLYSWPHLTHKMGSVLTLTDARTAARKGFWSVNQCVCCVWQRRWCYWRRTDSCVTRVHVASAWTSKSTSSSCLVDISCRATVALRRCATALSVAVSSAALSKSSSLDYCNTQITRPPPEDIPLEIIP